MSHKYALRHINHLVNLIKRRNNQTPNFALFIGAGASISSGVKQTSAMIDDWRQQLYNQSKRPRKPFDDWLKSQDWHEDDQEYSLLFERVYDQPAQRRIYIEDCLSGAKPSWGYIYLSNIIEKNYFNVIFTSNFDDLLNEACFTYANCKPILCAHDSSVGGIRVTSRRPKIIKLHGDFLYDNIKNTITETDILEKNMRSKFEQFAREYGLVVVGYGGADRSIMDILESLLRSPEYFPHGVYWCLYKGSRVSRRLNRFLGRERVFTVLIDGFDELMAEFHDGFGLTLPDTVRDPYKATTDRINNFIQAKEKIKHVFILNDIAQLETKVKAFQKIVETSEPEVEIPLPNEFLGSSAFREGNYHTAIMYMERASIQDPKNIVILSSMAESYARLGMFDEAMQITKRIRDLDPIEADWWAGDVLKYSNPESAIEYYDKALLESKKTGQVEYTEDVSASKADTLLLLEQYEQALKEAEVALSINPNSELATIVKSFALKQLGNEADAQKLAQNALPFNFAYNRAVAYGILGDRVSMFSSLRQSLKTDRGFTLYNARQDPKFSEFREDREFQELLVEEESRETIETSAHLTVYPNPLTVTKRAMIQVGVSPPPPTSTDSFHGFEVEIANPDGTLDTLKHFTPDGEGTYSAIYAPSQIGSYSVRFNYPGETFKTTKQYYTASRSPSIKLVVKKKRGKAIRFQSRK